MRLGLTAISVREYRCEISESPTRCAGSWRWPRYVGQYLLSLVGLELTALLGDFRNANKVRCVVEEVKVSEPLLTVSCEARAD